MKLTAVEVMVNHLLYRPEPKKDINAACAAFRKRLGLPKSRFDNVHLSDAILLAIPHVMGPPSFVHYDIPHYSGNGTFVTIRGSRIGRGEVFNIKRFYSP